MAVESVGNGGLAITGEHIEVFRLLSLRSALNIQVKTGLKSRAPVPQIVRDILLANNYQAPRKLEKLLAYYETFLKDKGLMK